VDEESHTIFFRRNKEEAMIRKSIVPLIAAVAILGLSACNLQFFGPPSGVTTDTAIAQTMTMRAGLEYAVGATLTALGKGIAPTAQPSSATISLTQGTVNLTPGIVTVSVSANTWCTTGPDVIYDKVLILYAGQTAEVVGSFNDGFYWIIRDPNNPSRTCWLWGYYATVTGDWRALPVYTPPPTPTSAPTLTSTRTPTPTLAPKVTAVSITVDSLYIDTGDSSCHYSQNFTVTITTNGPTTVNYGVTMSAEGQEWGNTGLRTMAFASAGTKAKIETFHWWHCGHWVYKVIVTSPNNMTAQVSFQVVP
jgi:hypothetical protein